MNRAVYPTTNTEEYATGRAATGAGRQAAGRQAGRQGENSLKW